MNDGRSRHPEAHTMAAFVDGTLAPAELASVASHLRDCSECRTVITETARFEREEDEVVQPQNAHAKRWWAAGVAAAVAAIAALTVPLLHTTPLQQLAAAAPRDHRVI